MLSSSRRTAVNDGVGVNDKTWAMSRDSLERLSCPSQKISGYRPVAIGRPRMTSFFVQVCTAPQCAHVNFCVFTAAVCQRFSSIVLPVSVSFEVEGHLTSRLLMLRPAFAFGRRGGSKKNLVAILESINNTRSGGVVGRHLHFYPIPNR